MIYGAVRALIIHQSHFFAVVEGPFTRLVTRLVIRLVIRKVFHQQRGEF